MEFPFRYYFMTSLHTENLTGSRKLPDIHHDPFDRILIAQAMSEPLLLITADGHMAEYTDLVKFV
jgi:PIN domain nuclease of toxin-antitoxin system